MNPTKSVLNRLEEACYDPQPEEIEAIFERYDIRIEEPINGVRIIIFYILKLK